MFLLIIHCLLVRITQAYAFAHNSGTKVQQNNQMNKYLGKKMNYARIIKLFWINRCQLQDTATVASRWDGIAVSVPSKLLHLTASFVLFLARGVGGLPLRVRSLRADILYPRPSLFCEYRPPGRRFLRFFLHMSKKSSKFAAQI